MTWLPQRHHCHKHITATNTSLPETHHHQYEITTTNALLPQRHHHNIDITATMTWLPQIHHCHKDITTTKTSLPQIHHHHKHITCISVSMKTSRKRGTINVFSNRDVFVTTETKMSRVVCHAFITLVCFGNCGSHGNPENEISIQVQKCLFTPEWSKQVWLCFVSLLGFT